MGSLGTHRLNTLFIIAGAAITIAATIVSDVYLTRYESSASDLRTKADLIRQRELEHQYNMERSFHDLDNAWALMAMLTVSKAISSSTAVRDKIADNLWLSLQSACLAGDVARCRMPRIEYYDLKHGNAFEAVSAFNGFNAKIVALEPSYGKYINGSNSVRRQEEANANDYSLQATHERVWGTLFQLIGIFVVLLKDLFTDKDGRGAAGGA